MHHPADRWLRRRGGLIGRGIVNLGLSQDVVAGDAAAGVGVDIHPRDVIIRRTFDFEASGVAGFRRATVPS